MPIWLSRLFLVIAVGLLGLAGYLALGSPDRPAPSFAVEQPDRDLGKVGVGSHTLIFRITNPADHPRRILGLAEG